LLGKGYLAFTVDQGEFTERYQGIVELKPESLIASAQAYFTQSEQIATGMIVAVGKVDDHWRGCGIMVQQMPEDSTNYNREISSVDEDDWRRTMILMGSVRDEELLNPALSAQDLLFRLFHEEGLRIYEPKALRAQCRCSPERVGAILATMGEEDKRSMSIDGKIIMTCEFCSRDYVLSPDQPTEGGGIS
jgi:molecular chaperone Hsp33